MFAKIDGMGNSVVRALITDTLLDKYIENYYFYCDSVVPLLFTENETDNQRLFNTPNASLFVKDGINNYIMYGQEDAVNPSKVGTKATPHHEIMVEARETKVIRLRLSKNALAYEGEPFGSDFEQTFVTRLKETDEFYANVIPPSVLACLRLARKLALDCL